MLYVFHSITWKSRQKLYVSSPTIKWCSYRSLLFGKYYIPFYFLRPSNFTTLPSEIKASSKGDNYLDEDLLPPSDDEDESSEEGESDDESENDDSEKARMSS